MLQRRPYMTALSRLGDVSAKLAKLAFLSFSTDMGGATDVAHSHKMGKISNITS